MDYRNFAFFFDTLTYPHHVFSKKMPQANPRISTLLSLAGGGVAVEGRSGCLRRRNDGL